LQRIVPLGHGQASAILIERVVQTDGTIVEMVSGQVTFPLACISDAIGILMSALMNAGLNQAVAAVKSRLGHVCH
jgi:hypothetical protein